ncbi:hypothetical protein [Luteimonas cellulosilyticus]|nr:hypothetical protein [Luteimonas cellulosilyticus]
MLPDRSMGWRNPVVGESYERTLWELYLLVPGSSRVLADIRQADGVFAVRSGAAFAQVADPKAAFELAAGWAVFAPGAA